MSVSATKLRNLNRNGKECENFEVDSTSQRLEKKAEINRVGVWKLFLSAQKLP